MSNAHPQFSAPSPTPARDGRIALIDGVRLVAALVVVLYHYTAWHHDRWGTSAAVQAWPNLSHFTMFGNMGVQLFFIISGFVILLSSYGRTKARYIGSRVGRLYPAYWVGVLLTGSLVLFVWSKPAPTLNGWEVLVNLTMFQGAFKVENVDGVYWTLWSELRFYIMILILMSLKWLTPKKVLLFAFLWPVIALLFFWAFPDGVAAVWVDQLLQPKYAGLFTGGMALFLIYKFGHSWTRWAVLLVSATIAAYHTGIYGPSEAAEFVGFEPPAVTYWFIVFGFFGLMALITLTPLSQVNFAGLQTAGAVTYPLYLLHQVIGWWLIGLFSPFLPRWLTLVLVIAMVGFAAWLINRYVEQPYGKKLAKAVENSLSRRRRVTAPAQEPAN